LLQIRHILQQPLPRARRFPIIARERSNSQRPQFFRYGAVAAGSASLATTSPVDFRQSGIR
jgi:hypothetical protein